MFRTARATQYRLTILAGLFLTTASVMAASTAPATDLGKSWPNAPDVSASPRVHVYVFQRDHIQYVQINDASGNVRAAFATANGQTLSLPMGTTLDHASVSASPSAAAQATATGELIYRDRQLVVTMLPQSNGITWSVQTIAAPASALTAQASSCGADPTECAGNRISALQAVQAAQASACGADPTECAGNRVMQPIAQ